MLNNYCEFEWTGGPIANQEVVQFPTLPAGNYRLSVDCASDANSKGVYLIAGSNTKELPGTGGINSFSLDFSLTEESPIKIGFKIENTTATWVNLDNFKLEMISSTDINNIKAVDSHHAVIYNLAGPRFRQPEIAEKLIEIVRKLDAVIASKQENWTWAHVMRVMVDEGILYRPTNNRFDQLICRIAPRPLYQGSLHLCQDQRDGNSEPPSGCQTLLGKFA